MKAWLEEYIDWISFPLLALLIPVLDHAAIGPAWIAYAVGGWITGTFAEYVIHRWVLHTFYWMSIHQRHHERPLENTRFPLYQIPLYFVGIAAFAYVTAGPHYWVPYFEGWVVWYVSFFVMHAIEHHKPEWVPQLAINHNAHHKLTSMNFGISVTWWDRVFGTYRAPPLRASRQ